MPHTNNTETEKKGTVEEVQKPIIDSADIYFANNKKNYDFVYQYFRQDRSSLVLYTFMPTNPADMGRLYRYDAKTNQMVRDFYNPDIASGFAKDPKEYYNMLNSHDLSKIATAPNTEPVYFYFAPGESKPQIISSIASGDLKPIEADMLKEGSPVTAALNKLSKERSEMSAEEKNLEKTLHVANNNFYHAKRTFYTNATIYSSNISVEIPEGRELSFAEQTIVNLRNSDPNVDYNYNTSNGRLQEEDMIAMTMLSMGNPDVTGDGYGDNHSSDRTNTSAGSCSMWHLDFGVERVGKNGEMLKPLKSARLDAKKNIEAYDKSGDKEILVDAVINGIYANSIHIRNTEVSDTYYANGKATVLLNRFIEKPWLKEAVLKKAEKIGKLDEILDAYTAINATAEISNTATEYNASLISAYTKDTPDKKYYENTSNVLDTVLKLVKNGTDLTLQNKYQNILTPSEEAQQQRLNDIMKEYTKTNSKEAEFQLQLVQQDIGYFQYMRPQHGLINILARDGGKDALIKYLSDHNLILSANSTPEQITEVYTKLEDANIIPKFPKTIDAKNCKKFWSELKHFDYDRIITSMALGLEITNPLKRANEASPISRTEDMLNSASNEIVMTEIEPKGILYDKKAVSNGLKDFTSKNPNASKETIEDVERALIAREAVIYVQRELYKKDYPNATAKEITSNSHQNRQLMQYLADQSKRVDFTDIIRNFQSYTLNSGSLADYQKIVDIQLTPSINGVYSNDYTKSQGYGQEFHRTLFASDTALGHPAEQAKSDQKTEADQIADQFQQSIDNVKIPLPEGMSEKLLEHLVMGACFKPERLIEADKISSMGGSTVPEGFGKLNTIRSFYFENLLENDERGNTQGFRSVVTGAREEIKELLEKNQDPKMLIPYLKEIATAFYSEAIIVSNHLRSDSFTYCVRELDSLLENCKNMNISESDLGFTEQQIQNIRGMSLENSYIDRYKQLKASLQSDMVLTIFSPEITDSINPAKNKAFHDKIVELSALQMIESRLSNEIAFYQQCINIYDGYNDVNSDRIPTPTERFLRDNPKALLNYYKQKVIASEKYKDMMNNPQTNMNYNNGLEISNNDYTFMPHTFESLGAKNVLNKIISKIDNQLKTLNAIPEEDRVEGYSKAVNALKDIKSFTEKTIKKRDASANIASDDNIKNIAKDYKKIIEKIDAFQQAASEADDTDYAEYYNGADAFTNETSILDKQRIAVEEMDKQSVFYDEMNVAYDNIRFAGKTLYERNFKETHNALLSCIQRPYPKVLQDMFDSMNTLTRTLNDVHRADTQINIEQISNAFTQLSNGINNYLNAPKGQIDDNVKFVVEGLQKQVESDIKFINKATQLSKDDQMKDKSFDQLMKKAVLSTEDASINDINDSLYDQSARLQELRENLMSYKDRFGGNSKSFTKFFDQFDSLPMEGNSVMIPDKKFIETLAEAAKNYIQEKRLVPKTEKGKIRLDIIKEVRDVCESMIPAIGNTFVRDAYETNIAKANMPAANLEQNINSCKENLVQACKNDIKPGIVMYSSKLVYLQTLNENKNSYSSDKLNDLLSSQKISEIVQELNKISEKVVSKLNPEQLAEKKDLAAFVKKSFSNELSKSNTTEKSNAASLNADKADKIISERKHPTQVGGISL